MTRSQKKTSKLMTGETKRNKTRGKSRIKVRKTRKTSEEKEIRKLERNKREADIIEKTREWL